MELYRAYVYGYFANKNINYNDIKIKENECFYIGIATNSIEERTQNHMKPSKYDVQLVNRVMQDNPDAWETVKLGEIELAIEFNKKIIHSLEIELVKEYKPKLNIYGKGV